MSVLELALRIAGMPRETIDEINKAMPSTAALLKLIKDNDALIKQIIQLAGEAQPLLVQALPVIKQAMSEIDAVLPAAQDVVAFLQKQSATDTVDVPGSVPDSA